MWALGWAFPRMRPLFLISVDDLWVATLGDKTDLGLVLALAVYKFSIF